jgi:hypothetical protein
MDSLLAQEICIKIDSLSRNLVPCPQTDISPFSFPQATILIPPRGVVSKSVPIHSNYCAAFWKEWGDLALFGDFRIVIERLCSTVVQLMDLRYKSGSGVLQCAVRNAS